MVEKRNARILYQNLPRKPSFIEPDIRDSRFSTILEVAQGDQQETLHQQLDEPARLQEENKWLKRELEYIHKLQSTNRKLLEDVQVTSALLRAAVLGHRREQKALDREYLQETRL